MFFWRELWQWTGTSWVHLSGRLVSLLEDQDAELKAQAKASRRWVLERIFIWDGSSWNLDHDWMYPPDGGSPIFTSY